jgi:hypothetical protein
MFSGKQIKATVVALCLGCTIAVSSASLLGDLGNIVGSSAGGNLGGQIAQKALERLQREAVYKIFEAGLSEAGVKSAYHFTDAIRAVVEDKDWGTATAAFYTGLDRNGTDGAREVIKTLYAIAITARLTNADVSNQVVSLIDYVNAHYRF